MDKKSFRGGKLVLLVAALYIALFLAGKYNDQLQRFVAKMAFTQAEEPGRTHQDYGLLLRVEDSLVVLLNSQRQGVSYRLDEHTEIAPAEDLRPGITVMVYATVHSGEEEPYTAQQIEVLSAGATQRPGGELLLDTGEARGTGG